MPIFRIKKTESFVNQIKNCKYYNSSEYNIKPKVNYKYATYVT